MSPRARDILPAILAAAAILLRIFGGPGTALGDATRWLTVAGSTTARLLTLPAEPLYRWSAGLRGGEPSGAVVDAFDDPAELELAYEHALREIERLTQLNDKLLRDLEELGPIRQLLSAYGLETLTPVNARVTGRTADEPARLRIAAGHDDGLRPGDAVVYRLGLVGRVAGGAADAADSLGGTHAEVIPLTDFAGSLGVRLLPPPGPEVEPRPPVSARLERERDDGGRFVIRSIAAAADVRPGDWVRIADELLYSGASGFQVGVVAAVEPEPGNPTLLRRAWIEPVVDPARLTHVTVLTREADR